MLRLYFNQMWGSVRTESRSFGSEKPSLRAGTDELSDFPLFGFDLPVDSYDIAEWHGQNVRLFPPASVELQQGGRDGVFRSVKAQELARDGERSYLVLSPGTTVRLIGGEQVLSVTLDEQKERAGWDKKKAAFWLTFMIIATLGGPLMFLYAKPDPEKVTRALQESRVKQGLPANPEPLDIKVPDADEPGAEVPKTGLVIPASVR